MNIQEELWKAMNQHLKLVGIMSEELLLALKEAMQAGKPDYIYQARKLRPGDVTDYTVTINLQPDLGLFGPDKYTASMRQTHPLPQTRVIGVDIPKLEEAMAAQAWDKEDALAGLRPTPVDNPSLVNRLVDELSTLLYSSDPLIRDIGERLGARYLLGTPMENVLDLSAASARFERKMEFDVREPQTIIELDKARNLLLGRSVAVLSQDLKPLWAYGTADAEGKMNLHYVDDLKITPLIDSLPILEFQKAGGAMFLLKELMKGERLQVTMKAGDQVEQLHMEVNAGSKDILLLNNTGEAIPLARYQQVKPPVVSGKTESENIRSDKTADQRNKRRSQHL